MDAGFILNSPNTRILLVMADLIYHYLTKQCVNTFVFVSVLSFTNRAIPKLMYLSIAFFFKSHIDYRSCTNGFIHNNHA